MSTLTGGGRGRRRRPNPMALLPDGTKVSTSSCRLCKSHIAWLSARSGKRYAVNVVKDEQRRNTVRRNDFHSTVCEERRAARLAAAGLVDRRPGFPGHQQD